MHGYKAVSLPACGSAALFPPLYVRSWHVEYQSSYHSDVYGLSKPAVTVDHVEAELYYVWLCRGEGRLTTGGPTKRSRFTRLCTVLGRRCAVLAQLMALARVGASIGSFNIR